MNKELLTRLRNKQPVTFFKNYMDCGKCFFKIQLNKSINGIAWQRFVSKDRYNWIKLNECLSLRDIDNWINEKDEPKRQSIVII